MSVFVKLHIMNLKSHFLDIVMEVYQGNQICQCRRCNGIVHMVKSGETLYRISRTYQVSLEDIIDVNPDINIYNLQPGDKVCVPVPRPEPRMAARMPRGYYQMPMDEMKGRRTVADGMSGNMQSNIAGGMSDVIVPEEEVESWMEPAVNPANRMAREANGAAGNPDVMNRQSAKEIFSEEASAGSITFTGEEPLSEVLDILGISLENFNKNKSFS